jgi:hypothetical protein
VLSLLARVLLGYAQMFYNMEEHLWGFTVDEPRPYTCNFAAPPSSQLTT